MSTETGASKRAHQPGDDRHDPVELLGLGHLGPRSGLDAADVEDVGPVGHQLLGPGVELVELEGGALVVERVGRAVEDAHDQRPVGEVVAPAARGRAWWPAARGRRRRARRPGRGHQNRRAVSALRYVLGARVVGAHRLEQVDELLAGGVVVAHPLEQLVELGLDCRSSVTETSTPASSRRASAARARLVSVSGRRARRASASAASPRSTRMRASASVAPGVVRLELEGLAQRGLVARGDQQVGLARGRGQPLDERGRPGPRGGRR